MLTAPNRVTLLGLAGYKHNPKNSWYMKGQKRVKLHKYDPSENDAQFMDLLRAIAKDDVHTKIHFNPRGVLFEIFGRGFKGYQHRIVAETSNDECRHDVCIAILDIYERLAESKKVSVKDMMRKICS